jgi:hypothetical protein
MLMPDFRVTLPPSFRSLSHLCPLLMLLLYGPAAAQEPRILPGRPVPSQVSRIAARAIPAEATTDAVTISRDEYERLTAAARAAAKRDDAGTAAAVVTEAHYSATIADGAAKIACRFVVQVLKGPWAEVPIDFGDTAVGEMSTDKGTTAVLRGLDGGTFALRVKEAGRHEIRLQLRANTKTLSNGSGFAFSGPAAGIATLDVVIPSAGQHISVSPTFVADAVTPKPGTSRIKGHLAAASKIAVSWQPERTAATTAEPVVTVDNRTRVRLREESLLSESKLTWNVHRGRLTSLQIVVPAKDRILDVSCTKSAMSGWTVEKRKGMQQIRVALSLPVSDRVVAVVRTERSLAEGTVFVAGRDEEGDAFGAHAGDSKLETGLLVLSHVPHWDVSVPTQPGWVAVDAAEIAGETVAAGTQYVRYFHPKTPFSIRVQPVKPRMTVTHDARVSVRTSRIDVTSRLQYQVDRIGVSSVALRLPKGLAIERVTGNRVKSFSVAGSGDVLHVNFNGLVTGKTELTVHGRRSLAESSSGAEIELPVLEPDGVDRESGRIDLAAPDAMEVVNIPDKTSGVSSAAVLPATSDSGLRSLHAWSIDVRPLRITVRAKRRAPRVTAKIGTLVDVRESGIGVTSELEFHVEHAPARTFRFAVPAAVADSLRVTDAAGTVVAARKIGPLAAPGGKPSAKKTAAASRAWTVLEIESPQRVLGKRRWTIYYQLDLPKPADAGKSLALQPIRVLGLAATASHAASELQGEISVVHARPFTVTSNARGGDVEPADGRELSFLPAVDGAHFQYHREPVALAIGIARLEVETVAETVVSRGLVEILVAADSTAAYRARYRVLSSERQRLRLDLPKSSEPLGAFVNGAPVTLERDPAAKESEEWTSHLIDVGRRQSSSEEFTLVVQFQMPVKPAPFQVPLGRLRLNLPRVLNANGTAAVVQQLRTVIWIPDGQTLVGDAENFARQTTTRLTGPGPRGVSSRVDVNELEAWVGVGAPGGFGFPTQGHAYRFDGVGAVEQIEIAAMSMPFATWVLSVPLLLIGFVLLRTNWHNRLNLVLLLLFAGMVAAVSWGDAAWHALLAARYGLAGVAVIWLIHAALVASPSQIPEMVKRPRDEPCPLPLAGLASVVIPPPGLFPEKSTARVGPDGPSGP